MKYMLDTNICIYAIKHRPENVLNNLMAHDPAEICISSITYAELMHGVAKSQYVEKNKIALTLFLSPISILDFNAKAADCYGLIRADLERKGSPIGSMDMLIAGHAMAQKCILVTNNAKKFERVKGLMIENWVL